MDYVLVHHGVKGMRWGVRNGPPYPLDNANAKAHNNDAPPPAFQAEESYRYRRGVCCNSLGCVWNV